MTAEAATLTSKLAQSVVAYLTTSADLPFAELTGIEVRESADVLHIRLEPELPQHRKVPILNHEPVTVLIDKSDEEPPRVFSARGDFPVDLDLVHTNRDMEADGVALCLWEEPWANLSRILTGQSFVERMRDWFSRTARGDVHPADQSLEPLLPGTSNTLIMPAGLPEGPWHVVRSVEVDKRYTLLLDAAAPKIPPPLSFALFSIQLDPVVHGALKSRPYDFAALAALIEEFGVDLLETLRPWLLEPSQIEAAQKFRALILIVIPLKRGADDPPESYQIWAYSSLGTLAEFGEHLGITITAETDGHMQTAAALGGQPADLSQLLLMPWRVVPQLDRSLAREFSANPRATDATLVAIGAGAIGSNLVINSMKAGVGSWTIIDDDLVLPHNIVRQTQTAQAVGVPKALALAHDASLLVAEAGGASGIIANVLKPGEHADAIESALTDADFVIDLSASPAVVGYIADHSAVRRAASFFFNPDGSDLVVLVEDADRKLQLDEIEAQYFLASGANPCLARHFASARVDRLRYANACQDLTRPLPPWQVQTLSGIATGRLLAILGDKAASARVWRMDPATALIVPIDLALSPTKRVEHEAMRVSISNKVVHAMQVLREERSPNETGGILVGTFDLRRNILHIVAALPAPPDSRQSPTYFIRGALNLRPIMDALTQGSAGQLQYVGEWHSHPDGAAARPSHDDEGVFSHLAAQIEPTGSPFAMMICGAEDSWIRVGWAGRGRIEGVIAYGDDE